MTTVVHKVTDVAGNPLPNVECKIDIASFAYVTANGTQLTESAWATSDILGVLTFTGIVPNDQLTPAGTHYLFSSPYTQDPDIAFVLPDDGEQAYQLTDNLVGAPDSPLPIIVGVSRAEFDAKIAALTAMIPQAGASHFTKNFAAASDTWEWDHNLGYVPIVELLGSDGSQIEGKIATNTTAKTIVTYYRPVAGTMILG